MEDDILLQHLDELALKIVGNGITVLCVHADGQGVAHSELVTLIADHISESPVVFVGSSWNDIRLVCVSHEHILDRTGSWRGKLDVEGSLRFQALDFITHGPDLTEHLVVLIDGGSLDQAVLSAMLLQITLRLLPMGVTPIMQFHKLFTKMSM